MPLTAIKEPRGPSNPFGALRKNPNLVYPVQTQRLVISGASYREQSIRSAIAGREGWEWRTATGDSWPMVAGTASEIISDFHPNITIECPLFLSGKHVRVEKSLALRFLFLMGGVNRGLRTGPSLGRCFHPRCLG